MTLNSKITEHNNWKRSKASLEAFKDLAKSENNKILITDGDEYDSATVRRLACADRNGIRVGGSADAGGTDGLLLPVVRLYMDSNGNNGVMLTHYGKREWEHVQETVL